MAGAAANVVVAGATLSLGGTDVGFTQGGVSIRTPRDFRDVEADQQSTLVKKVVIMTRMMIRTTLLEPTLVNLQKVWGQAASGSVIAGVATPFAAVVVGTGPAATTRTVTFGAVTSISEGEYNMTRDQENTVDAEFEATTVAGLFATIADV